VTDLHGTVDGVYQGAPGSYSEEAARALLGSGAVLNGCATLADAFNALSAGQSRSAVVPIENTLAGAVPGCADLLARRDVHIAAERVQLIQHALIAPPGVTLDSVKRVLSHPVALAQCETFFRNRPHLQAVPVFDTAGAVADVVAKGARDAAAIAGSRAATLYGAQVLADGIQDHARNFTRFLLLRRGRLTGDPAPHQKTSIFCVLPNVPGALAGALQFFASRQLNLCRIESLPIRESPFEYGFHLDIGPTADPAPLRAALRDLAPHVVSLRILGHYDAGQWLEPPPVNPASPARQ
jgi:prephenate dehydratase